MNSLKRILAWRLDLGFVDPLGVAHLRLERQQQVQGGREGLAQGDLRAPRRRQDRVSGRPAVRIARVPARRPRRGTGCRSCTTRRRRVRSSRRTATASPTALKLTGRFSGKMSWKVDVLNAAGTVFSSVSGFGSTIGVNWYGKDSAGAAVPQDVYRFKITGKNSAGTIRTGYVPVHGAALPERHAAPGRAVGQDVHRREERPASSELLAVARLALPGGRVRQDDRRHHEGVRGRPNIGFRDGSVVEGRRQALRDLRRRAPPGVELDADRAEVQPRRGHRHDRRRRSRRIPIGETLKASQGYPGRRDVEGIDRPGSVGDADRDASVLLASNVRDSYVVRDVELAGPADAQVPARRPTRSASATAPSSAPRTDRRSTSSRTASAVRSVVQGVRADGVQGVQHPDGDTDRARAARGGQAAVAASAHGRQVSL